MLEGRDAMSLHHRPADDEKLEKTSIDSQRDDSDDDESKTIPPLYICIHRNDPKCNDKHPHPPNPIVYDNVTRNTPCLYCGHTGTLRRVN